MFAVNVEAGWDTRLLAQCESKVIYIYILHRYIGTFNVESECTNVWRYTDYMQGDNYISYLLIGISHSFQYAIRNIINIRQNNFQYLSHITQNIAETCQKHF